jgi:hypothetical protein
MKSLVFTQRLILSFLILSGIYCSKGGGGGNPAPNNPCAGITVSVNATTTNPTAASSNDGIIAATASGGTGFTFNLNGGTFQTSGTFNNLAAGTYTIVAKNNNGCTGTGIFVLTAPNPGSSCSGVTININTSITNNTPCATPFTGAITATASGGTGPYTFSLNGGTFQSTNSFSNLNTGQYFISAKDANGCSATVSASVNNSAAGPLFTLVKQLTQNNCISCHNAAQAEGGMDWTVDCNIITFKDRIKARAVDGNPTPMPQTGLLPPAERQKITNWINAGGRYSD